MAMDKLPDSALTCGLDEAGRGPLAGPLVAAAVVFPPNYNFVEAFPGGRLRDSKKLTRLQREALVEHIRKNALTVKVASVSVREINARNIGWVNYSLFWRLIAAIQADLYIVDGILKFASPGPARIVSVVRADEQYPAVAAASIIAKVHRDNIMRRLHALFPVYGWDHNQGYGTREHIAALRQHGMCVQHRTQFVQTALSKPLPGLEE